MDYNGAGRNEREIHFVGSPAMHPRNPTNQRRRVARASPDFPGEQLDSLKALFPSAVSEGRIDLEKLRELLGDAVDDRPERYTFTWAGKRDSLRLLQTPSRATLAPCPELSDEFVQTGHVFIEGENLEVLKLLYKPYAGRVKMIYIDPPYNTGGDFVYPDDFKEPLDAYLKLTGQRDAAGNPLTSNPETGGRYHSNWLSMMYPRLFIARQLLRDDGVIFVSIDDHEAHNLRLLMNELFGEENYLATFVWKRRSGAMDSVNNVSSDHEYVLCYGRDNLSLAGEARTFERYANPDNDPRGPWIADNLSAAKPGGNTLYPLKDPSTGREYLPPKGRYWPYAPETMKRKIAEGRIIFPRTPDGSPLLKRFKSEAKSNFRPVSTWIGPANGKAAADDGEIAALHASINTEGTREIKDLFGDKVFSYPKPVSLLRSLVRQGAPGAGDIVLDFFAGSCTTAQAVLEQNRQDAKARRFIMVQLPEPLAQPRNLGGGIRLRTIADIGRERIRRVAERLRKDPPRTTEFNGDREDLGFRAFRLAESNFRPWTGVPYNDPDRNAAEMALFPDALLPGWKTLPVIHEVAIREGYGLSCSVERVEAVTTNAVYRVTDADRAQSFFISLDPAIDPTTPLGLGLGSDDLFVCRDSALTAELAAKLAQQCQLRSI